jgi:hypothetical protein
LPQAERRAKRTGGRGETGDFVVARQQSNLFTAKDAKGKGEKNVFSSFLATVASIAVKFFCGMQSADVPAAEH